MLEEVVQRGKVLLVNREDGLTKGCLDDKGVRLTLYAVGILLFGVVLGLFRRFGIVLVGCAGIF